MGRKEQFKDKLPNPSELTIEWAGGADAGHLKAYDKDSKSKIKLGNMSFVVLKEKNCLDGFLAAKGCGAWSNEVTDLKTEPITVMYKDDGNFKPFKTGMYADIVEEMKSHGIKYHKVIYAMVVESSDVKTGTIVRLMFKGAAASSWFKLSSQDKHGLVALTGSEDGQTGAVRYKIPTFKASPITEEADKQAEEAYGKVDAYLKSRAVEVAEEPPAVDDDIPF
jgi:hypothetical protein